MITNILSFLQSSITKIDDTLGTPDEFYQKNWVEFLQPNLINFLLALGAISIIKSIIFR